MGTGWEDIAMVQMQRDSSWYQDRSDEGVRMIESILLDILLEGLGRKKVKGKAKTLV